MSFSKRKIAVVFGTRPEVIKMAPVVQELRRRPGCFDVISCNTGQHRDMARDALADFEITADENLDVMQENQSLASLTARVVQAVDAFLLKSNPEVVLVQGDTTTAMAATLAAFYRQIPVGHVEAGLRSGQKYAPFPEEVNRRIAGLVAALHFAPTAAAADNLRAEHVAENSILVTGNTVVDALLDMQARNALKPPALNPEVRDFMRRYPRFILMTGHRRENFGDGFEAIVRATSRLAETFPATGFLYPVHLNPRVREPVHRVLVNIPNILLTEPQPYAAFVCLLKACRLVLTDSGGVQEEAPTFGKPVLVMRDVTERPEGVAAGTSRLVGTDENTIYQGVRALLEDDAVHARMAAILNPFGDGRAAARIADALEAFFRTGTRTA